MSESERTANPMYEVMPREVDGFDSLAELALDMQWSWNHATDEVWRQLDPMLWDLTHNPWAVLQTVSKDRIERLSTDAVFRKRVDDLARARRDAAAAPAWFQRTHPRTALSCIAYFSMEFMLSEALPIYSGGLGNVAGDQLKAASDLGVPLVAVGLLYSQGYFRQVIDGGGAQQAVYPYNDPGQLPITPLRRPDGEWLRLELDLPGQTVWLRAWLVRAGRLALYLLDSNDPANSPVYRGITSELYGGGPDLRLLQELVLGIGGWQLLTALGIHPEVCHLNEGHAAFAVLERARVFMEQSGQPFDVALAVTRAGNLFTTHTAVAAGFDRYDPSRIEHCLGGYAEQRLRITRRQLLALGQVNPDDPAAAFNMAYLAIRGSGAVNAVSRVHGEVSRKLFAPLFPRWPLEAVPVGHVTNGVHMPTWDSAEADDIWTIACGKNRWLGATEALEHHVRGISDARLWQLRTSARRSLVEFARSRLVRQLEAAGASADRLEAAKRVFDPDTLTLGFARRFATYKRPNLLLHDPERLLRLLNDAQRPVQLILAGKAHPADRAGQVLVQEWTRFIDRPEARERVVFLSDYDMLLAGPLVQGVDVWLNTPRRPWEACGTSGMKVLVNGGLNLSELDGWWAEAYTPEVGWALGDREEHGDDPERDAIDAHALYERLEREVIPEFYSRDQCGIPKAWLARMRESMARLTPQYSTNRTVREYTERYYLPAAAAYRERAAERGAIGECMMNWRRTLARAWPMLRFGESKVVSDNERHLFEVEVYLGGLDPSSIRVELYAEGVGDGAPATVEMIRLKQEANARNGSVYSIQVPATRPAADYTARLTPVFPGAAVPLEAASILWQR
jgi:starch phosphorylase